MPLIHVELVEGRTKEQKKQLGEAITKVLPSPSGLGGS